MPGARWFEGAELNYAEALLARVASRRPGAPVPVGAAPAARGLRRGADGTGSRRPRPGCAGSACGRGDRVVAVIPNIPEAVVALLACASIGAIWSSCSPDFGTQSLVDRFAQIEPTVLIAVDGYTYGGKPFDRRAVIDELRAALPTLRADRPHPVPRPGRRAGRRRRDALGRPPRRSRRAAHLRAGPVRPSALGPLLVGHDRPAQGDRPRPRRRRPRAREGDRAAVRRPAGRPDVVVHDDRLDDVELPGRLDAGRRRAGAVRRQPGLSDPRRPVGPGRASPGQPVRDERRVPRRVHEGGHPAGRRHETCRRCGRSARPARRCRRTGSAGSTTRSSPTSGSCR